MSRTLLVTHGITTCSARLGLLAAIAISIAANAPPVAADDWQVLFDGRSLAGWKASQDNKQFEISGDTILGSSSNQTHFLITEKEYGDFELELEIKLHDVDLNSGVQIRTSTTRLNDKKEVRPNVHGPQVDIGKSPGRSGFIFGQGNKGWITPKDDLVNHSLMKNGEWNKLRVRAVGHSIQTWINGEPVSNLAVSDEIHAKYPKGVIALQVHGVKKSPEKIRHVSFRSIRVREINK